MKDKKREEMPDILSDILGNKPEPKIENKPSIKSLEYHDVVTPQHQNTTDNETKPMKQNEEKPDDNTASQCHDAIVPVTQDKQTTKPKIYRTTLYLPEDLYIKLDEVWLVERKNGISKNSIIELALRHYIYNKNNIT